MIRTTSSQSATSFAREAQIVCDACGASTSFVDIGCASTDRTVALVDLRLRTGFIERIDPLKREDSNAPIRDLCARCAPPAKTEAGA